MQMIESYKINEKGYHPFLIREGWQLAQLNYTEEQHIDQITKLDVHLNTDEAFFLMSGIAVLIAAEIERDILHFQVKLLMPNVIYNIPRRMWHNIALEKGCQILIAEKDLTHISDVEFYHLNIDQQIQLRSKVKDCLEGRTSEL